ncbi:hypothetical protein JCM6882_007112 [Rhodosporidiobolus microsporus]
MQSTTTTTSSSNTFDSSLAATLFPNLVNLASLASSSSSSSADSSSTTGAVNAATSKLELSKQAAQLRTTLAALKDQAAAVPAGNLSLEDQDWLIERLEGEVQRKRDDLAQMAQLTALVTSKGASPSGSDAMDTA